MSTVELVSLPTAMVVDSPQHGQLVFDGEFVYTPDEGFLGTDSFTYEAFDGEEHSNVATVTINVNLMSGVSPGALLATPLNPVSEYSYVKDSTTQILDQVFDDEQDWLI